MDSRYTPRGSDATPDREDTRIPRPAPGRNDPHNSRDGPSRYDRAPSGAAQQPPPQSGSGFASDLAGFLQDVSQIRAREKEHKKELHQMELKARELNKKLELSRGGVEPLTEGQRRTLKAQLEDHQSAMRKKNRRFEEWMRGQCDGIERFVAGLKPEELKWVNKERRKMFGLDDV
ncbi:hypothetical protein K440DRAFT_621162 [Wilcoxina mikolae CBS 423.85]|nr:hypothetical protein K440DRAFT_621162 [Wilcoxina mikolae CBS 423.85]